MQKGFDFIGVAVVYFCHDGKGNYLFAKRSQGARDEPGTWDTGGGGLEFGETVEECLAKEIKEEYCADILQSQFLGYRDVFRDHDGRPTRWIAFHFKVLIDPAQAKIGEPHKFDELRWFRLDHLPPVSELHSQTPLELEKYKAFL